MTPQELKNSILQMAIQGKLVEQRHEEGTAEELFAQIQEEKKRLIAEKKIKKEKPLPEITEDEKPFDIPESWKWCRLGNILYKLTDGAHSTPKYKVSGVPFLSVKDMSSGKLDFSNCKYISEEEHQELFLRCNPEYGDLLLTKIGTTGIPVIVDTHKQFSLFVSVALLKFDQNLVYNKFLQFLISSPLVQIQATENTRGVGNKNWVMRDIANTIIALPPLAEQKRIVAKIEELLPYIDRYEQAWSKLEQFNSRFPDDMKKSLLQYAIQGKLVEQRPEEGTAEELFAQIQEEKKRLIAEKKIKKEKPLPEITDDEKPFDIPESWKWLRLGNVISLVSGTDFKPEQYNAEGRGSVYITGA
ncbi:MAG TPA: restriction endonuclease subunit S, partial [Candidatus Ruthenibacterium avium]|nr:restriction endonuclease subunit S [Candidatus Ruthenibacterium avium]